ncbi:1-acyl-sn-glycerol-3-phosphate acyltransferase gamma [Sarcoptes scabiei]|uniref:1-acyl-sn-glycerol-3-phosphate acyltransferase gamma n=1 Tax=Sarcoptes scabiei TaxID=52283 RepID=A0A132A0V1_SARSC|nr:1-acyl-sn-glycerol-3-phosphate acyltransferase gamma [Sarcoptes scabiei]KPM04564.1 1-acyl-sn-glycerol-3-phosphate acyltransferase-like protein 1 [Sarcoptes scabiei]
MQLKTNPLIHLIFSLAFFLSGLCINFVQSFLYFTLAWFDLQAFRRLNFYLNYSLWSQIVALAQWWAHTELTIYYPDKNALKLSESKPMICLMNHTFEIDWVIAWLAVDYYQKLGNAKSFVKKSLRWIPIIGWSWIFGEFTFLERNLEKDSKNIIESLTKFLQFEHPVSLLCFAEGTRFTKTKHENSMKFAQERHLPILKHHLLPRPRGFHLCVKTFQEQKADVYIAQIQLRFSRDSHPTFMKLLRGEKLKADMFVKIFSINEVPCETEQATTDFLYSLYQNQDQLADYYEQNESFPGLKCKIEPRLCSLLNWISWLTITILIVPYLLSKFMVNSSWTMIFIFVSIILVGILSVSIMINSTKIKKASSYGIDSKTKKN